MSTDNPPPPRGNGAPPPPEISEIPGAESPSPEALSPETRAALAAQEAEFERLAEATLQKAGANIAAAIQTFMEPYLSKTIRLHAELQAERAALRWTLAGLWLFPLGVGLAICLGLMVGASIKEVGINSAPPPPVEQLYQQSPPPFRSGPSPGDWPGVQTAPQQ